MDLTKEQIFRFEDIEIDLARGCLLRGGDEKHLRRQAFHVLVYLIERRERLVPKGELFDAVWKDTAVTDDVLVQCITEIRRVTGDDSHRPRFIKTVPKSGYRFIGSIDEESPAPVTDNGNFAPALVDQAGPGTKTAVAANDPQRPGQAIVSKSVRRILMAAAILVTLGFAGGLYIGWPPNSRSSDVRLPQIEGRKAVAVMFFENQSKSPQFDWLREGLADMLIAGLSRTDKLTVLSREQLFTLMGRSGVNDKTVSFETAQEIARKSQAEYFVTGSFTQIGETIRLDVRLYETKTGDMLTTESLTVEKAEQLLTQIDFLSLKISNRLGAGPAEKPDMVRVMTYSLEAYRFYSLGVEKAQALHSEDAIKLFQKAIALDPNFAMAQARIGYTYAVSAGDTEKGKPYLERAYQLASRLTEKDRLNIDAWYAIANLDYSAAIKSYREIVDRFPLEIESYARLARLLRGEGRPDEAIEVLRQGLAIDVDAKDLYNSLGSTLSGQGKHAEAIAAHERYVALAPNESNAFDSLGLSYEGSGDYKKALEKYERALELNPKFEISIVHLGNVHIRLGQYNAAIAAFNGYIASTGSSPERVRGYDSISYVNYLKGDFEASERAAAAAWKIDPAAQLGGSYLIAVKKGQASRVKALEKVFLSRADSGERGSRLNRRFELYYRGTIALNNGETDQAIEYFRQMAPHPPPTWHFTDFQDSLGSAYLKLGRFDEAIAEYQNILRNNPNYPLARFHLGEAYRAKGMIDEARESFRLFLDVWKDADRDIPEIVAAQKFVGE